MDPIQNNLGNQPSPQSPVQPVVNQPTNPYDSLGSNSSALPQPSGISTAQTIPPVTTQQPTITQPDPISPVVVTPIPSPTVGVPGAETTQQVPIAYPEPPRPLSVADPSLDPRSAFNTVQSPGIQSVPPGATVSFQDAAKMQQEQPVVVPPVQSPQSPAPPAPLQIPTLPAQLSEPSKKITFIIASVFIAFSIVMVGFSFRVLQIRKKEASKVAAIDTPSKKVREEIKKVGEAVQDRPDRTLDLDPAFDPYFATHDQDIKAKIGQQINASDGQSFIVKGVKDWSSSDKYTKPKPGKKFIRVDLLIGNRQLTRKKIFSYDWKVQEGSGKLKDDAHVFISDQDEDSFAADEFLLANYQEGVDSQQFIKAILIMEVSSAEPLTLVYSANPSGQIPGEKDTDYPTSQSMKIKAEIKL